MGMGMIFITGDIISLMYRRHGVGIKQAILTSELDSSEVFAQRPQFRGNSLRKLIGINT